MADIIQLLPDAIANKIAAGEVIQRPASVVKELMENAVDAGSTRIQLIVKDAGKTLIQVIDNGCGMSGTDARRAFERHATSKIRQAEDLFAIRTMGFRGEALASVAAVAHVELRTRRKSDELGTRIDIEGSEVKKQEACQAQPGTSIAVKNLFYNIPVRRNFLKSDAVELRHIVDEFQRIAMANPDIFFSFHHNNEEIFHLPPGNLRQRITAAMGSNSNKKLVPVTQETDILRISGFIGKPEFAKKTRGEQFFFVNDRFIKSGYLHHAVVGAYENLLPEEAFPLYIIFIEIDPQNIDINIHPTKQEIKFEDERLVYNYLKVAVRHALGQHSIMPTLDFDQDYHFSTMRPPNRRQEPTVGKPGTAGTPSSRRDKSNLENWHKLYEGLQGADEEKDSIQPITIESSWGEDQQQEQHADPFDKSQKAPYQIHASYIVSHIKSGFLLIDQQAAHERILYEKYLDILDEQSASTQQQLFPKTVTLSPNDALLLKTLLPQIDKLGFDIQEFGLNTFVVNGIPSELVGKEEENRLIEALLERYKANRELKLDMRDNIARTMARSAAIKRGKTLSPEEMQALIDQLFACALPFKSPSGRSCFITMELEELEKRFEA